MFGIEFSDKQKTAALVVLGLALVVISCVHIFGSPRQSGDGVVIEEPGVGGTRVVADDSDRLPISPIADAGKVVCHVTGCVRIPGVYTLEAGKRVIDAVHAAGGAKADADLDALNLAAKIEDGSKIEIPSKNLASAATTARVLAAVKSGKLAGGSSPSGSDKLSKPGEGLVHINSASSEELQRLPGVGPATAEKIAAYRASIRRFSAPEQLMDVKGIGPKKFEKMRPFVAL